MCNDFQANLNCEDYLQLCQENVEDLLLNLGFGIYDDINFSRIPDRFLKSSQLKGNDIQEYLKRQEDSLLYKHNSYGYRGLTGKSDDNRRVSTLVSKVLDAMKNQSYDLSTLVSRHLNKVEVEKCKNDMLDKSNSGQKIIEIILPNDIVFQQNSQKIMKQQSREKFLLHEKMWNLPIDNNFLNFQSQFSSQFVSSTLNMNSDDAECTDDIVRKENDNRKLSLDTLNYCIQNVLEEENSCGRNMKPDENKMSVNKHKALVRQKCVEMMDKQPLFKLL